MTQQADYAVPGQLAEVDRLLAEHPMGDAVVDEVEGRMVRIGGRWLADFASCNHLGLDLDPEVLAGVPEYLARWETHYLKSTVPVLRLIGPGPGPCSTTSTSWGGPPPTPRASRWSSWPWPTPTTSTPSAGTCSTGAST